MNQSEYFKISEQNKLPKRCPILDRCMRWAWSAYFFSEIDKYHGNSILDQMKRENIIGDDFIEKNIQMISDPATVSRGQTSYSFKNTCPEIPLFNSEHRLVFVPLIASTCGDWDSERISTPKFHNHKCSHYSECPEFVKYHYENTKHKKPRKKRELIPTALRLQILVRDNYKCMICGRNAKEDNVKLHIDHIIPLAKAGKTEINNLRTLCQDCNLGKSDTL